MTPSTANVVTGVMIRNERTVQDPFELDAKADTKLMRKQDCQDSG